MQAECVPVWMTIAVALAACGGGGSSNSGAISEVTVPFQNPSTSVAYSASSASVSFTAGTGITATGAPAPADTAGNTVTLNTDGNGGLSEVTVTTATTNGGPTVTNLGITNGIGDTALVPASSIASLLSIVAGGGVPQTVYQGSSAGLSYSGYGIWMQNAGGHNYNVGTYALGSETTTMPTTGTASYSGTTLGFGSNGAAPFAFTGAAALGVNFATGAVSNVTFSGFTTQDVNDGNPGPTLPTLTGSGGAGTIVGNKFAVPIAGGALGGSTAGAFYGPNANETAGTFQAAGGGISLIGSFGAHH